MKTLRRFLRFLIRKESFKGSDGSAFLERWTVANPFSFGIYLHHFMGDDPCEFPHSHPSTILNIGFKGGYLEDIFTPDGSFVRTDMVIAPWCRIFGRDHTHRIRAKELGGAWSIIAVANIKGKWGFVKEAIPA